MPFNGILATERKGVLYVLSTILNLRKKDLGITNEELAKESGVSLSAINKITAGVNTNPKLETLQAICDVLGCDLGDFNREGYTPERPAILIDSAGTAAKFFDLDEDDMEIAWEISRMDDHGRAVVHAVVHEENKRIGAMFQKAEADVVAVTKQAAKEPLPFPEPAVCAVAAVAAEESIPFRVFDEPAAAGSGNYLSSDEICHMMDIPASRIPEAADFGVPISGLSMEPQIPDGAIVFVRATPAVNDGDIGIFVLDGQSYCKQLQVKPHQVLLHSLNPEYQDVLVPPYSDFRTVGQVIGVYVSK